MVRQRYPGRLPDLSRIGHAPLLDDWLLEPDDRAADGAVLTGVISGHPKWPDGSRVTTSTVQQIEDQHAGQYGGWAWCYSTGLLRLGVCIDLPYSRGTEL